MKEVGPFVRNFELSDHVVNYPFVVHMKALGQPISTPSRLAYYGHFAMDVFSTAVVRRRASTRTPCLDPIMGASL